MSGLPTALAAILADVRRPGAFAVSGRVELPAPGLEVEGVGPVALPLLPAQAGQLLAAAEPAPYGKGEQTLIDPAVRHCRQIGAERVRLTGRHWTGTLASMVERAAAGFGLTGAVEAEFYKLLLYPPGGFFVGHRDTEKAPGMFATLVVVLPSLHDGGELLVRHRGREERFDLRPADAGEAGFAAFYADCIHEVRPVTAGCRLVLIYNLVRKGKPPAPPDYDGERIRAAAVLRAWAEDGADAAVKLVWPLEHVYTPAELGFATLKGADAGIAEVLAGATADAGCDLHLARLTIEESGGAECFQRSRWSETEFEAGEVFDRSETLSDWLRPDDTPVALGALPLEDGEIAPPDALEDLRPDEEEFHEATGNAGASFERSYRRAALVLWPRARRFTVLRQGGQGAALGWLADLAGRRAAGGETGQGPLWQEADALAGEILASWHQERWLPWRPDQPGDAGRLLESLTRLGNTGRIPEALDRIGAGGGFPKADAPAIAGALTLLTRIGHAKFFGLDSGLVLPSIRISDVLSPSAIPALSRAAP